MTNKQIASKKFPGAKAQRDFDQGYTIMQGDHRLAWAPSAAEAWRIAAQQPVRA